MGTSPHPALGLHWGKIQKHQQKKKHTAFNRLPGLDSRGPGLSAALQKVPAELLAPRLGDLGPVLTTAGGLTHPISFYEQVT